MMPASKISSSEVSLRAYCERVDFTGWDPWDALGSPLFKLFPFNQRLPRWAGNHLVKIAPVNVRPLLGIGRDCFAKGLALFMSGYILREKGASNRHNREVIEKLYNRLKSKMIPGYSGPCWGTNLPYQTRAFYVPAQTPSAVHTAFAVEALLDLHDLQPDDKLLESAVGACHFVLQDLKTTVTSEGIYFSYTPQDNSRIINVTALVARMLARTGKLTGKNEFMERSKLAAAYVISRQSEDGSWFYGEDSKHKWIDNYHTGFVLEALEDYTLYSGDDSVSQAIDHGAEFYYNHLFLHDGTPKFTPGSIYPIDGHCLAQGILTFVRLRERNEKYLPCAWKIAEWGCNKFQHEDGYFFYQKRKLWLNRIPYIRWVQAWMFLALNKLLITLEKEG